MTIIHTSDLHKHFKQTHAVNWVDIHVQSGEIYGFLGLNAAGKSTTIRMLLGMIRPTRGSVSLFGKQVDRHFDLWQQVGYLVEDAHAYPQLTVRENLELICKLRRLNATRTVPDIIERLQLGAFRDVQVRHLSTGNNQRLGLARALIHKPRLLVLDEPVNGLDPAGIVEIRHFLQHLVSEFDTTIFLSSHILSEIARLATRIGIVHQGRLIRELNSAQLDREIIRRCLVRTADNREAANILNQAGYSFESTDDGFLQSSDVQAISEPERVATQLVEKHLPPVHLEVHTENLEDFFIRTIGEAEHA